MDDGKRPEILQPAAHPQKGPVKCLVTMIGQTCQNQFAKIRGVDVFTDQGSIEHLK